MKERSLDKIVSESQKCSYFHYISQVKIRLDGTLLGILPMGVEPKMLLLLW